MAYILCFIGGCVLGVFLMAITEAGKSSNGDEEDGKPLPQPPVQRERE